MVLEWSPDRKWVMTGAEEDTHRTASADTFIWLRHQESGTRCSVRDAKVIPSTNHPNELHSPRNEGYSIFQVSQIVTCAKDLEFPFNASCGLEARRSEYFLSKDSAVSTLKIVMAKTLKSIILKADLTIYIDFWSS